MKPKPHSHFLSLPRSLSKSGQKPSAASRLWFITLGFFISFVASNLIISAFTEGVIFPGVSVSGVDLSFKTRQQARKVLSDIKSDRSFDIKVGDKVFRATGTELGARYDSEATLDIAYGIGRSSPLPVIGLVESTKEGQIGYSYQLNDDQLKLFTSNIVASAGKEPINASIKVVEGKAEIVDSVDGYQVDQKALTELIRNSVADGKDQNLHLDPKLVKASFLASDAQPAKARADDLLSRKISLQYEGKEFTPDRVTIGYWLVPSLIKNEDGTLNISIDVSKDQIKGYLQSIADQVYLAPKNKKIQINNGVATVEQEGVNGKTIAMDIAMEQIFSGLDNAVVGVNLTSQAIPFQTETNRTYSGQGKYIEVNLSSQRLWAYQGSQVIFSSYITSGATGQGFPTVTGLFSIYAKERSRYLNGRPYGWDYNVFVDYWMPFYGGYGLHDADWRNSFGGQDYYYGGSHGCVNMPKSSAAFLYGWSEIGTPVQVHN
jgi:lipoprotein-anchoring transpeptidase ErfK/SrfK